MIFSSGKVRLACKINCSFKIKPGRAIYVQQILVSPDFETSLNFFFQSKGTLFSETFKVEEK